MATAAVDVGGGWQHRWQEKWQSRWREDEISDDIVSSGNMATAAIQHDRDVADATKTVW